MRKSPSCRCRARSAPPRWRPIKPIESAGKVEISSRTSRRKRDDFGMPEYAVLYWLKYRLPVVSFLLMSTDRNLPASPPTTGTIVAGDTQIITHYRIIRVWELSAAAALASGSQAILPFVPLMDGGRAELEAGAHALRGVTNEPLQREMALHFVMLGALRYNPVELLEFVGRPTMIPLEQLKESAFYQLIVREGREEMLKTLADAFRNFAARRFPESNWATKSRR
jgi:hypothetical protein